MRQLTVWPWLNGAQQLTCILLNSAACGLSWVHSPRRPSKAILDGVTVLTRTSGTLVAAGRDLRSCSQACVCEPGLLLGFRLLQCML